MKNYYHNRTKLERVCVIGILAASVMGVVSCKDDSLDYEEILEKEEQAAEENAAKHAEERRKQSEAEIKAMEEMPAFN